MNYKLQTLAKYLVVKDVCLLIFGSAKHGDRMFLTKFQYSPSLIILNTMLFI